MRLSDLNNVPVAIAAKLMGVGRQFIRMGMQREQLPFLAQQKYERFSTLYGAKSDTSMMPLFQYESLHGVIERAGLVSEYTIYYKTKKKLRGTVCAG